jgi:hypothetical protein
LFPDMGVIDMAHSGVPPKTVKHGRTPNADWTDVVDRPYEGPSLDLPKSPGAGRRKWHDPVVAWWEQVRRMPHCVIWTPTDWLFAIETAYMKQQFWHDYVNGELHSTLATEIRRREDQMGCTGEARRKLRIRYISPDDETTDDVAENALSAEPGEDAKGAKVTDISQRRRRLAG